ncbi:MAG: hypothetical protein CMP67_11160 [Flavobacteriales bacterium]|nr:hypothetical protein [Flavobacteriales bacterium]MBO73411.1 hypothetical protein [Flavobacteriales bacterium]|tara:strand:+ start:3489 stop:3950 length:462 start_codon:yes stop_codon:yes gene_type:complete
MDQTTAKEIIKDTDYLENRILVMEDSKKKIKYCKIIWKGFSATQKDENNEEGAARVRVKDLMSGKEFTDNLTKVARDFPEELISNKESAKAEIFNLLQENKSETKTLNWIEESVTFDKEGISVERLLTELWLESKVTKARFKSDDLVVYNSRK